jgi:hypothetical protein
VPKVLGSERDAGGRRPGQLGPEQDGRFMAGRKKSAAAGDAQFAAAEHRAELLDA